uniref:Regulator of nonsense transcripts 2 n=1 Tax=Cacopsylla melanoneura TaxID=428564 RepID=A0A8D8S0I9_9HEMI
MLDMGVIAEEDDGEEEEKENNIGEERRGRKLNDERRVGGNHNNAVINNKDRNGETNTTETDGGRNASETDETAGNSERMDIDDEDEETEEFSEEMPLEEDETDPPQLDDDDDFLPEFEKMVSDNLQERTREMTHKNKLANLSVPVNFGRSNLKQNYEQLTAGEQEACTINFMLMVRTKSNKQSYKPLVVPKTCDLVLNLKSQEKAKKDEMEQVKKLTLNITDRLEEEDYHQEVESGTRNLNHGSHHRSYKHQSPKGPYTPDAELIFGKSKKSYASKFS